MSLAHKFLLAAFSALETSLKKNTSLSQYESEVPSQTGIQSTHKLMDIYHGTNVTSASTPRHLRINAQMQKERLHGETCSGSMRILWQFSQLSLCNEYVPRNMKRKHKDICMNTILFWSAIRIWEIAFRGFLFTFKNINRIAKKSDIKTVLSITEDILKITADLSIFTMFACEMSYPRATKASWIFKSSLVSHTGECLTSAPLFQHLIIALHVPSHDKKSPFSPLTYCSVSVLSQSLKNLYLRLFSLICTLALILLLFLWVIKYMATKSREIFWEEETLLILNSHVSCQTFDFYFQKNKAKTL